MSRQRVSVRSIVKPFCATVIAGAIIDAFDTLDLTLATLDLKCPAVTAARPRELKAVRSAFV